MVFFRQFYLGCLAHASYLIGADGEAAVVDPQRDVDQYIAVAEQHGLAIKYVIETHLHADFVSGHRELAERTGATIVIGAEAHAEFAHRAAHDGDRLMLGNVALDILATPGHTPESICIVVDGAKVLTGDTLFIGDVGRPDLAAGAGYTPREMASMLYDSLHEKLLKLDDSVEVYPAHGAGSLCGKNISKETSSTIGQQRRFNYALQPMSRESFIDLMTNDLAEAPAYFAFDAMANRRGARALQDVPRPRALTQEEVAEWCGLKCGGGLQAAVTERAFARDGGLKAASTPKPRILLDVRPSEVFCAAHIPGSINIALGGQYASWAGSLLDLDAEIALIAENEQQVDEAVMRLARVGIENARGYFLFDAWTGEVRTIQQLNVNEVDAKRDELQIVDVRRTGEYRDVHARDAVSVPLHELRANAMQLDRTKPIAVICASGYRSTIGTSILEQLGFAEVYNVTGGTAAWRAAGLPVAS